MHQEEERSVAPGWVGLDVDVHAKCPDPSPHQIWENKAGIMALIPPSQFISRTVIAVGN